MNSVTSIHCSAFNSLNHKPGDVKKPHTHLCLLGSSLLLFFSTTLHILIILASLIEWCQECIKDSKEIIWLNCWVIFTKQPYSSIKLKHFTIPTILQLSQTAALQQINSHLLNLLKCINMKCLPGYCHHWVERSTAHLCTGLIYISAWYSRLL